MDTAEAETKTIDKVSGKISLFYTATNTRLFH
jgi:hypothetical protein